MGQTTGLHDAGRAVLLAFVAAIATLTAIPAAAGAASGVYTNGTPIAIPNGGPATPYPSQINVQGLPGRVVDVDVALREFAHATPVQTDVLLESPGGKNSIVMSDACGSSPIADRTWLFDQAATATMSAPCSGVSYKPIEGDGFVDPFPPLPSGYRPADFRRFIGDDPNGVWDLFVHDQTFAGGTGSIGNGWFLVVETAPVDTLVPGAANGTASPYPATREVSNLTGVIEDVEVSIAGVHHERTSDLELVLVGPGGQSTVLMSDACVGRHPITKASWSWDDEAATPMPSDGPCPSGSYRPTDTSPDEGSAPPPAPPGPYGAALSAFDGTPPNGQWRIYAYDDYNTGDTQDPKADGFFSERFQLRFETRPRARVSLGAPTLELAEGEAGELTLTRTGGQSLGAASVAVTSTAGSATEGTDYEPVSTTVQFARGQAEATVPLRALDDADVEGPETLTVALGAVSGDAATADPSSTVVTIRDTDGAGGQDQGPDGGAGVDSSAPETTIDAGPKRRTERTRAKLRFSSSEAGSSFQCKLDRKRFAACSPPRKIRRLGLGRHRFLVRAVDRAGNVDPTPAKRRWKVID